MINRIGHIVIMLGVIICITACSFNNKKPNIILILTDDQGWGDVGFNGNEIISTPTLDNLANNSVVFNRFYVSPVCAPTRASLLTGKDHLATGVSRVTGRKEVMKESEVTMGEIFKANGYNTSYFGKWHNGSQYPHTPNGQGFSTFFGFCGGHINSYFDPELTWNNKAIKTSGYITDVLTDSLITYIENQDEPYLAYVAYNTPHTPYQVADKYFDKYKAKGLDDKIACIYGMCENIDDNVARIISKLKELKQYNNTLIIYMSDNGPNFLRYNGGLKGRKAQVDEGGVRVPFLISYPEGNFYNRKIYQTFANHLDVLPTLLSICGIVNDTLKLDGVSFKELLYDENFELPDRTLYTHHVINQFDEIPGAVRKNNYLLTMYPWDTALYNLESDPYQRTDISASQPQLTKELSQQYHMWFNEVISEGIEPSPVQLGYSEVPQIILPVHEGKLFGNLVFAGDNGWANDWIIKFNDTTDHVSWPIRVQNQCVYNLKIKYACSLSDKGLPLELRYRNQSVEKQIADCFLGDVVQNPDRVKRSEVNERIWGELDFGSIDFVEGANELVIAYEGNRESNIQIKELILNRK